jgi:hypothetical protein
MGCPSLLRSVRLWITGTSVVEWDSRRVTRSTVPRCEVQVVMITPGYALAPLTGTPGPANARENPGRSSIHPTGGVDNEATFTTFSLLSRVEGRAVRLSCSTAPTLPGAHDALRNLHRAGGPSRA